MKKGKIYSIIAGALYVLFWILLIVFGLTGNPVSRFVLDLFDSNANIYFILLTIILFAILIFGTILSSKGKTLTEGSRISKIIFTLYWIAIALLVLAICAFIFFLIMMVVTGSYM